VAQGHALWGANPKWRRAMPCGGLSHRIAAPRVLFHPRMPQILTRRFGPMDFDDPAILDFPLGLPGFERARRFGLVERAAAAPLVFLQSLDFPELCFVAAPVELIDREYHLDMTADDLRELGFDENQQPRIGDEVICLALLSSPENGRPTANLLAPVVIERASRRAVQAVRSDSRYSHQHSLTPEARPGEEPLCS